MTKFIQNTLFSFIAGARIALMMVLVLGATPLWAQTPDENDCKDLVLHLLIDGSSSMPWNSTIENHFKAFKRSLISKANDYQKNYGRAVDVAVSLFYQNSSEIINTLVTPFGPPEDMDWDSVYGAMPWSKKVRAISQDFPRAAAHSAEVLSGLKNRDDLLKVLIVYSDGATQYKRIFSGGSDHALPNLLTKTDVANYTDNSREVARQNAAFDIPALNDIWKLGWLPQGYDSEGLKNHQLNGVHSNPNALVKRIFLNLCPRV